MEPHIVQSGDTLSGIAKNYGVGLSDILKVNPGITNPNLINPGQSIQLPTNAVVPGGAGTGTGSGTAPVITVGAPTVPQATDISTELARLGLNLPTVDDGTQAGKLAADVSTAKTALEDFNTKLKNNIDHVSNNPFLLSDEIVGEQKRVINQNQDTLKTLTNNYNTAVKTYTDFQGQQDKAQTNKYNYIKLAADKIQNDFNNTEKTQSDKNDLETKIQTLRNETPAGQKFTVNGQTYTGLKVEKLGEGQQATALKAAAIAKAEPQLLSSRNGGQFVDGNEYLKLRTDYAAAIGSATEFDDAFSALLSPSDRAKYGVGKSTGVPSITPDAYQQAKDYVLARKNAGIAQKDIKNALDNDVNVSAGDKLLYDKAIVDVYGQ